jgi:hypothetical protein
MERLIGKPSQQPSQEDKPQLHWQLSCSCAPYLNGTHSILHKNRLDLKLKENIFYQTDSGSLLMAALPYLSHWLPHLSNSSMKELIQGGGTALETALAQQFYVPKLSSISKTVCKMCSLCAKNNP